MDEKQDQPFQFSINARPNKTAAGPPGGKKPYRKPACRFDRVFETMALSCGKVQNTQAGCHFNRKVS